MDDYTREWVDSMTATARGKVVGAMRQIPHLNLKHFGAIPERVEALLAAATAFDLEVAEAMGRQEVAAARAVIESWERTHAE